MSSSKLRGTAIKEKKDHFTDQCLISKSFLPDGSKLLFYCTFPLYFFFFFTFLYFE